MKNNFLTWLDNGTCRSKSQTIIAFSLTLLLEISLDEIKCLASELNSISRIGPRFLKYSFTTFLDLISQSLRDPFELQERKRSGFFGWNLIVSTTWSSVNCWISIPFSTSSNFDEQSYPQDSKEKPRGDHLRSFTAAPWLLKIRASFCSLLHTFHTRTVPSIPADARRWPVDILLLH